MATLTLFRVYDFWTTGFLVSDEHNYITQAITGQVYADRYFFGLLNIYLFKLFAISNIDGVILLLPFYLMVWSVITIFAFYETSRLLWSDERVRVLSLYSLLFLISFVLLSLGFLTEPVGLAMAMLGIYFLVKTATRKGRPVLLVVYPFLSALAFSAARYTREPYAIFLFGGIPLVLLISMSHWKKRTVGHGAKALIVLSLCVVAFAGPSVFFLEYPTPLVSYSSSLAIGLGQALGTPIQVTSATITQTSSIVSTLTTTIFSMTTSTIQQQTVTIINGTTTTLEPGQVVVVGVPKVVTSTTSVPYLIQSVQLSHVLNNQLVNTLWIFFAGLTLGWGPILLACAAVGFVLLLKSREKLNDNYGLLVGLALLALGSYLVVSFLFSADPTYISFAHYSTILRFSDTALPAYFIIVPLFFAAISKHKKTTYAIFAILLIFTVAAIPAYESFASSNLNLAQENPFALNYRIAGVDLRDYVLSNPSACPLNVIGFSTGLGDWESLTWTPGAPAGNCINVYPYMPVGQFAAQHWSTFYVYLYDLQSIPSQSSYLIPLLNGSQGAQVPQDQQFALAGRQVIFQDSSGGQLVKIELNWF